ncbi:hypothetical protein PoMZ_07917 [Pyricularia oryzae]|uniref:Uncharacterized protein n=1 Tax=Pyricularia oryzae TaxID=318829 RepID=A0A4P7NGB0_PYROR|nr:hypothetical protein PoMZ_07917 [Pyricularia oryzae]
MYGCDTAPLLDRILELLEQRVLKDGVDNENQRRHDATEQRLGTLVPQQRQQRGHGPRRGLDLGPLDDARLRLVCPVGQALFCGLFIVGSPRDLLFPRGHACVDDPDGVRDEDGGGPGEGAGQHGLDRGQLARGAAGAHGGLFEKGARPLVPVVVDKVGDGDAEEG